MSNLLIHETVKQLLNAHRVHCICVKLFFELLCPFSPLFIKLKKKKKNKIQVHPYVVFGY